MATRTLQRPPSLGPLYARAAAAALPGAGRLPFISGGGGEVPDTELVLDGVRVDRDRLAAYDRVCGFALRDTLPPTYPHVLAFGMQMALMASGSFPLGAVGLVHIANEIVQQRPLRLGEPLSLAVRATPLAPHARGRTFTIVTEARVDGELVWAERSTNLSRGGGERGAPGRPDPPRVPPISSRWRLPADLGRRYAAVSGDRNPIHISAASAKLLGFPRAIAHGMWSKARCLAALEHRLPGSFAVHVDFRRPILLPARVAFGAEPEPGGATGFAVRDERRGKPHLDGAIEPR